MPAELDLFGMKIPTVTLLIIVAVIVLFFVVVRK